MGLFKVLKALYVLTALNLCLASVKGFKSFTPPQPQAPALAQPWPSPTAQAPAPVPPSPSLKPPHSQPLWNQPSLSSFSENAAVRSHQMFGNDTHRKIWGRVCQKPWSFVVGGGHGFTKNLVIVVLLLDEDKGLQKTLQLTHPSLPFLPSLSCSDIKHTRFFCNPCRLPTTKMQVFL